MNNLKRIAILGSTGSIGIQALDVIRKNPGLFRIELLAARRSSKLLIEQAIEFTPNAVIVIEEQAYREVKLALENFPVKVFAGRGSMIEALAWDSVDMVLNALVGFAGLEPTLAALKAGKAVALANKESLVAGGHLVMKAAFEYHAPLLPVDSEHSAIFQCLSGENATVEKLILTASGGPFFNYTRQMLEHIGKEQALKHPTWDMGAKVTIDSATLMNKGLEVIEAFWLFGQPVSHIQVLVHPQSLIHSMVQFTDGSIKAQIGWPDMRLPIQYALSFPHRLAFPDAVRMDIKMFNSMQFFEPDMALFPCLGIAYEVIKKGGNTPCALNAANETAVSAFLEDKIRFTAIPGLIEQVVNKVSFVSNPDFLQLRETHEEALAMAQNLLKNN